MQNQKKLFSLITFIALSTQVFADGLDEDLEDILNMKSELKADVGSRSGAKNFLQSRSPVDVITYSQIESTGLTSLTDVLRYFVAGFNAPETSIADGSDHIKAFTLRGMSPDQVLVLIDGKRVHTSALLHVNGTIGRGSSHVDLDTIALAAIDKIEILRDGAAAQYGSDAISGVINIILKTIGHENSVSVHSGIRKKGDGERVHASAFVSIPLKYDGFTNFTLSAANQKQTQRAGNDIRVTPTYKTTHVGLPDAKNINFLLNSEVYLENDVTIYANILANYRESKASAFFRPVDEDSSINSIYPNGFLPIIKANILDYGVVVGTKGRFVNDTKWDLSNSLGFNKIDYKLSDSMNYYYGANSPTSFNIGELNFLQNTTNLDFKHSFNKIELALGGEYRYENYQIKSGDKTSYTNDISQGFSGYKPENEVDNSRSNYAIYLDGVYKVSKQLSLEAATRYEDYSDFGDTLNVKLSLDYKMIESMLLRTSASTGFRAPSLAQSSYSHTSTFGGTTQGTFKPNDPVAIALGAKDLKAEKSKHFTIGSVIQPSSATSFMIDYFYVYVDDKIMLSNELETTMSGVNKARFFTNAIDTKTYGVDIKLNHRFDFKNDSKLHSGVWYNYSKNSVVDFNDNNMNRNNSYEQIDRIENGQPQHAIKILNQYEREDMKFTLNLSRFGSYSQVIENQSYKFDSAWTTDLDISYKITKDFTFAIGGQNIFDIYPNKFSESTADSEKLYGSQTIKPYSRYSPFGYSGAYYYLRADIRF